MSTPDFWKEHAAGLALFRSRDHTACYRLPTEVKRSVIAADSFHIRPLIRFLQSNQRYFLLSLSQNYVRLFKGSASGLGPVEVAPLPRSLEAALGTEERGRSIHVHYGASGTPARKPTVPIAATCRLSNWFGIKARASPNSLPPGRFPTGKTACCSSATRG